MRKRLLLFTSLLSIFSASFTYAQNYLGVHSSNYAGAMGTNIQPASFVDGRFVVDINLFSTSITGWNNANALNTEGMPGWWRHSFAQNTAWMKPDSTFKERNIVDLYKVGQRKHLGAYVNTQLDVLNVNFHVAKKVALGFGIRGRMVANVEDMTTELYKLVTNGLDYSALWNQSFSNQNANISMMA